MGSFGFASGPVTAVQLVLSDCSSLTAVDSAVLICWTLLLNAADRQFFHRARMSRVLQKRLQYLSLASGSEFKKTTVNPEVCEFPLFQSRSFGAVILRSMT